LDLPTYYQETADYLVAVRQGGLALSATDDEIVARFYEEGVSLALVLRSIDNEAKRQKRLKRPSRNLPLRLVAKGVNKELKKRGLSAADSAAIKQPPIAEQRPSPKPPEASAGPLLRAIIKRAEARLGKGGDELPDVIEALEDLCRKALEGLDEHRVRARVVGIAKRYLDARVDHLATNQIESWEAEIRDEIGTSLRRMSPSARVDTIRELLRRRVAANDDLFPFAEILP